jgi:signal transduction histidine kinase/CheY-like chemotaxis protein
MIVVESPERRAMAPIHAMMRRLVLTTALMLTLALVAAWVFGSRLTTPLSDLANAASGISTGDYSRRVTPRGHDEVGTLATAFNAMADSIQTAHRTVEERSEQLAERAGLLADQAAQLETSNAKLTQAVGEAIRTRDELSVVSAELDAALASAPVGFAFHDATGRYKRVNASLARLNDASVDAHLGRLPSEVAPGIGAQLQTHLERVVSTSSGVFDIELSDDVAGRHPQTRHWLVSIFPIRRADGQTLGVGSVVTDLTAYKQLEKQLLHAQKMEAVGRLAGGVAHDFNNILTAVSGFGQFVLAELIATGSDAARGDMEEVLSAAQRAAALTRQLLAFSRQQVLQPRVLDLNAVVAGLTPMLARLIGTDIQLQTIRPSTLGAVKADPSQLEQVIANLVLNARDAMPNGGLVVIETADVELSADYAADREGILAGPYVMLAVTDSGVGMDASTRSRAFDPFFTTKEPGSGTGLGLSTVYGIVKQSGGSIEVYSEPGHGTAFKVYLPRCFERADAATPARSVAAVPNGQATLLVVDDDPQVLAASRRALERAGYVVLSANNGWEALAMARLHGKSVDLVITDLVMPEMGGRELARQLTAERPEIRLLFTSGYTAEAMNQKAILDPSDAFLGKPFTPDGLLRAVHGILNPDG